MSEAMTDKKKPDLYIIEGDSEPPKAKATAKKRRLTAKQERFVAEVIKGSTASDAYRKAYDAEGMKASAIWVESSRMMGNPIVALRLQAHRDSIQRSAVSSALTRRRWIVERLEHEAAHAESDAARVRSLELLGKTTDIKLFADIVETSSNDQSPEQVKAELEEKLTALLSGSG
jgi:phage terminase small subunit